MQTEAFFDNIRECILDEIGKAKTSILVAVAWFTDREIFELLCEQARNGIHVEILILKDSINRKSGIDYGRIESLGGKLIMVSGKGRRDAIMHNKFCVIDAETVITGSYNWSYQAQQNYENITVISENPELAAQFQQEFATIKMSTREVSPAEKKINLVSRLEALRNVIHLEDEDDITRQLAKLRKAIPSGEEYKLVWEIARLVEADEFDQAVIQIDEYLRTHKQLTVYIDPEITGLQLELKSLELQVSTLEDERAEMEKLLHAFRFRYAIELGSILQEILELRVETLAKEAEADSAKQAAYEEALKDGEDFQRDCAESLQKPIQTLTEEDEQELKAKYRACSKLCHPDVVAEEHKKEAAAMFTKLTEAYEQNDLKAVSRIYEYLKRGIFVAASESLRDIQRLYREVVRMRERLNELARTIVTIKESEPYQELAKIADWDEYFKTTREQFEKERERLKAL